ncbi:hypothetical protein AA958_18955 [Streptomyces sp. CNQ-509]|uniref:hypothetical protein n=1 Tax=Streptomyces sp. CNQ-509 TaxID=444103 RepID=UPI00062E0A66|nr:hypothetical protein [Streptomyces sp. CNQ-509]AKH83928.1 hypothetical protein AA958_18955 [Streptomyces sp. CNQ-509]
MPAEYPPADVRNAVHQLRTLAERTHHTADEVPFPDPYHPPRLCDLHDSAFAIARLLTYLVHDADTTRITGAGGRRTALDRFMITELTRAAASTGRALAALSEVIAPAGARAIDDTAPFDAVGNRTKRATPVELDWIQAAHAHLAATSRRLHQAADHLRTLQAPPVPAAAAPPAPHRPGPARSP